MHPKLRSIGSQKWFKRGLHDPKPGTPGHIRNFLGIVFLQVRQSLSACKLLDDQHTGIDVELFCTLATGQLFEPQAGEESLRSDSSNQLLVDAYLTEDDGRVRNT